MLSVLVAGLLDYLPQLLIIFGLPALVLFLCGKKRAGGAKKDQPSSKGKQQPAAVKPSTGSQDKTKSSEKQPWPQSTQPAANLSATQPIKSAKSKEVGSAAKPEVKEEKEEEKVEKKEEKRKEEKEGNKMEMAKEEEKKEEKKEKTKNLYPTVKEPTVSEKKKKKEEAEQEKKQKIADGFYQAKSDEDDTLEQVQSLAAEQSIRGASSRRNQPKKA